MDPFAAGYRRMASDIYWNKIRRHCGSVVEFLERYWADVDAGIHRELEEYQAAYPGYEALIEREFRDQTATRSGDFVAAAMVGRQ